MNIVVVGAGIAGLGSALALARDGHTVTVLERDATPMPASADEAFLWARRGAPQVRHSHAMLARLRNLLRDRCPDVLEALLDAGATEMLFMQNLPETLTDFDARDGDGDLVALACRRTTFEWVLRRYVLSITGIEIRDGVLVDGFVVDEPQVAQTRIETPRVVGVRTNAGLELADLVIDASGPRTPSATWLHDIGVIEPEPDVQMSEIVYFSRFYRLREGFEAPVLAGPVAGDLGYLKFAVFVGDNRTFSLTYAVDSQDQELRSRLADADGFELAAQQLMAARPWIDGRSEPITEVHVMAGLKNRRRHFVVDGSPIVTGVVSVGDASVCTNPLYGRGCSLSLVHAFGVADLVKLHGAELRELALAVDEFTRRELDPWFKAAVQQDLETIELRESRALEGASAGERVESRALEGASAGERVDTSDVVDPKQWARDVFREGLMPAMRTSPVVFRAFLRWFNLLATPDALMNDPAVIVAVLASYQDREHRPPEPLMGPASRDAFLVAVS